MDMTILIIFGFNNFDNEVLTVVIRLLSDNCRYVYLIITKL